MSYYIGYIYAKVRRKKYVRCETCRKYYEPKRVRYQREDKKVRKYYCSEGCAIATEVI